MSIVLDIIGTRDPSIESLAALGIGDAASSCSDSACGCGEPSVSTGTPSLGSEDARRGRVAPFKVLFADPPAKDDDYDKAYPNLGILQIISYVREQTPLDDDDILFLDQFHSLQDHLAFIEEHRPRIYGLSFAFLTQRIAHRTINAIMRRWPEMLVTAGGPHPTSVPDEVMEKTLADVVCIADMLRIKSARR